MTRQTRNFQFLRKSRTMPTNKGTNKEQKMATKNTRGRRSLLIDMWATGDGMMRLHYINNSGCKKTVSYPIVKSWLSMVYRFKNFTKQDKERIENFFTELQRINDY